MAVQEELPKRPNSRAGAGWWMDGAGAWRPPEEWPEDTPPFEGWVRNGDGIWSAPEITEGSRRKVTPATAAQIRAADETKKRLSRQARADRRAMLTVVGALGGAAVLLIVALVLITQAGASDTGEVVVEAEVIYAAEDDQAAIARRRTLAAAAPTEARSQLDNLERRDQSQDEAMLAQFDAGIWTSGSTDCLDVSERVLVDRSAVPVTFVDQLECVADGGSWYDRYLASTFDSVIEVDVQPLIPVERVHVSGGSEWTLETRQAYLADLAHPATLHIVAAEGGHNPRSQGPEKWRPSNRNIWCAYAVDWVAVAARWELSVTEAEVEALDEMLTTCDEPESLGADPNSMPEGTFAPASIAFEAEG